MKHIKLFIISGGPGTGKTSVVNELAKDFEVLPEAARELGDNDSRFKGKSIKEIGPYVFQRAIFDFQREKFNELKEKDCKAVFSDRGFGDTLAYYKFHNLKIPEDELDYAKKARVSGVFIMDFLDFYEKDKLRQETNKEQKEIQALIIEMYKELGYKPIIVPFMTVKERVKFILSRISQI